MNGLKKISAAALVAVLTTLFGSIGWAAQCLDVPGDVDGSGVTTVVDVQCGILVTMVELNGSGINPNCAVNSPDANCSGDVNVSDVLVLINYALGSPLDALIDANGNQCVDACEVECVGADNTPCDDDDPCTDDWCSNGTCNNAVVSDGYGWCEDGNTCISGACAPIVCSPFTQDEDCDDGKHWTVDSCNGTTGQCSNNPLPCTMDAECGNADPCTVNECIGGLCALAPESPSAGDPCGVNGTCQNWTCDDPCTTHADCNDGVSCTFTLCNNTSGQCEVTPQEWCPCDTDADCDDGWHWTTDVCDPIEGCSSTPWNCETDADCGGGDSCTVNICLGGVCALSADSPSAGEPCGINGTCELWSCHDPCITDGNCSNDDTVTFQVANGEPWNIYGFCGGPTGGLSWQFDGNSTEVECYTGGYMFLVFANSEIENLYVPGAVNTTGPEGACAGIDEVDLGDPSTWNGNIEIFFDFLVGVTPDMIPWCEATCNDGNPEITCLPPAN